MPPSVRIALVLACLIVPLAAAAAEPPRTDPAGDPLPAGATARLGTLRFRGSTSDIAVAFIPDGKNLATVGNQARILDVRTGKLVRRVPAPNATMYSVAVSPDSKLLATCGTNSGGAAETVVRIWNAESAKEIRQLAGHNDLVFAVAFSPDGQLLASASYDGTARLWEVAIGREVRQFASKGAVQAVAFSPDGRLLGTASKDGMARVWEVATGQLKCEFPGPADEIRTIAFSPDGELLAWGAAGVLSLDRDIRLGQVATGKVVRRLTAPGYHLHVAFLPDGKILASSTIDRRGGVQLWDVATGQLIRNLTETGISALAISPDGKLLAGVGGGNSVRLWDLATGKAIPQPDGHTGAVSGVAFSADGRTVASAGRDGTVRRWDAVTGRQTGRFETKGTGRFQRYAFSPDAQQVAASGPRIWDVATGTSRPEFPGAKDNPRPVAFSQDGRWFVQGGSSIRQAEKDVSSRVWDMATGKEVGHAGESNHAGVEAVAVSPDGALLAEASQQGMSRASGQVILWDRAGGKVRQFGLGQVNYSAVAFSPDGKTLATATWHAWAGQGGVQLWEVATGRLIRRLGEASPAACVAFSTDGKMMAAGRGVEVELWDAATGEELGRHKGHEGRVTAVAFSPDGKTVASGSDDTTVLLWPVGDRGRR